MKRPNSCHRLKVTNDLPGDSDCKESACRPRFDPSVRKIPWRRRWLQYSCLENPMDRGAWQATVHGVAKSRTRMSDFIFTFLSRASQVAQ